MSLIIIMFVKRRFSC